MCGIAGIFTSSGSLALPLAINDMTASLRHRGPDAGDTWCDADAGVALLDLGPVKLTLRYPAISSNVLWPWT
jgi:asparagine synthetase B (glutamine-hydrolysing)